MPRSRNADDIALFHRWNAPSGNTIDPTTWDDLGMDEVFAGIDRTASMPGRQVLFHQLRTRSSDSVELTERSRQHGIFRRETALREQIQLSVTALDGRGAEEMAAMVLSQLPDGPRVTGLLYFLGLACPACWIGIFFLHALMLPAIALSVLNAIISSGYSQTISPHFKGFSLISALLGAALKVGQVQNLHALPQLSFLAKERPILSNIREQLGWLVMDRDSLPDLIQSAFEYLNLLCLFDIIVYLKSLRVLRRSQATLVEVFKALGSLDAAIAVASYLEGLPYSTTPTLVTKRLIDVEGLFHPLIPDAVDNSLTLSEQSALIAGPNMAGKTAFIRTIGINLILSQTLNLCLARKAVLPQAVVQSAIRREDKLSEGHSYFFTEVQRMKEFTDAGAEVPLRVFLIDEIFRGTNTTERIAGSAAVLRYLAREHIVFATTHDSELQEILSDAFTMYHFTDQILDGLYHFDYRICLGPVRTRNAIKLLELCGFPSAITEEATQLAARFERAS